MSAGIELITNSNQKTIVEQLETNPIVNKIKKTTQNQIIIIVEKGKTSMLWMQCVKMISLFKSFIESERTGNFHLHLSTIIEMIPFFHACGHFNYAKSAHLYVQDNLELETKMNLPKEFKQYVNNGYFTIRCTNKFFRGTSPDMVFEQTMMRNFHGI